MTPRAALTKHLLDGDDSFFTGNFDRPVNGAPATPGEPSGPPVAPPTAANGGPPTAVQRPAEGPAPFDADAT